MFNVKLVKVRDYYLNQVGYINLNFLISFSPDSDSSTELRFVDGSTLRINQDFDDFVDYLVDLSEKQRDGGEDYDDFV